MTRQLNHNFHTKKAEDSFSVSKRDWDELQKEMLDMKFQLKNTQGGIAFLHSKMVKITDQIKKELDQLNNKQHGFEEAIIKKLDEIKSEFNNFKTNQEGYMTNRVKELIDQHHNMDRKYQFELQDLCRSLTEHSEQVWGLADQLQEIKDELKPLSIST